MAQLAKEIWGKRGRDDWIDIPISLYSYAIYMHPAFIQTKAAQRVRVGVGGLSAGVHIGKGRERKQKKESATLELSCHYSGWRTPS